MNELLSRAVTELSEFETKYESEEGHLEQFGIILQESSRHFEISVIEGRDDFYSKGLEWIRHRSNNENQELTIKRNIDDNIAHRIELNLNVGATEDVITQNFLVALGYTYSFTLFKESVVYNFADAVLSFYKVKSAAHKKSRCFIEIEVYNNIPDLDEKKAWRIIRKYEKMLTALGVNEESRLNSSLYDMYKPQVTLPIAA